MLKFLLIFIFLVGAAFGIPAVRARITPPLAPLLDRLGPVGRKLSDPAKKIAARNEAGFLLRKLAADYQQNKALPDPLRFRVWMKQNTHGGKGGLDPWGHPYYMVRAHKKLGVGSQGPDRKRNTADDIRVTVPFDG